MQVHKFYHSLTALLTVVALISACAFSVAAEETTTTIAEPTTTVETTVETTTTTVDTTTTTTQPTTTTTVPEKPAAPVQKPAVESNTTTETATTTTVLLQEGPPAIRFVTEPDTLSKDVYYVMKKQKVDPSSFTWVDGGISGKALQLDGITQHLRLATAEVKKLSAFTFSAWVNWKGNTGAKQQRLLSVYKNENHCLLLSPHNQDDALQLNGIQLTLEDPQVEPLSLHHKVSANTSSALAVNEWHHVAVTLSDTRLALYIDGVVYAEHAFQNFEVDEMDPYRFVIGSEFEGDAQFNGLIDEALLYTEVLDDHQIALLAEKQAPIKGVTVPADKETLATKPNGNNLNAGMVGAEQGLFGLSPIVLTVIGCSVVLVLILSLVLSLLRKNSLESAEEDHP